MKSPMKDQKTIRIGFAIAGILLLPLFAFAYQASSIPNSQLLNPDELVKLLQSSTGEKPLVIQVGSHVLYTQAHISGSEYIGPASSESGLQQLRKRVSGSAPEQVHRRFIAAVVRRSTAPTSNLLTTHCARWDSRTSRCSTSLTILARTGWTKAIQRPRETEV
jgi:hypothetical protein